MASPGALQPQIREIVANNGVIPGGIIPFSNTIFLWQSFVSVIVEIIVVTAVMWLATPPAGRGKTAKDLGIALGQSEIEPPAPVENRLPPVDRTFHDLNYLIVAMAERIGSYFCRDRA